MYPPLRQDCCATGWLKLRTLDRKGADAGKVRKGSDFARRRKIQGNSYCFFCPRIFKMISHDGLNITEVAGALILAADGFETRWSSDDVLAVGWLWDAHDPVIIASFMRVVIDQTDNGRIGGRSMDPFSDTQQVTTTKRSLQRFRGGSKFQYHIENHDSDCLIFL